MKKQIRCVDPEEDLAEFEAAATRLEKHLDKLGVSETTCSMPRLRCANEC